MEHEVIAEAGGVVRRVEVAVGETVEEGQLLAVIEAGADAPTAPDRRRRARARRSERQDLDAVIAPPRPRPRRRPSRGGRQAPRAGPPHRAGEPRRPRRPGHFVEYGPLIFAAQERAPVEGRADPPDSGRRPRRRRRRHRRPADGRHVLRLHRAGRHPGDAQSPQEGPAVRARRAAPAAAGAVRRGRRRPAGRRRLAARRRSGLPRLSPVRAAERAGAAGRDRLGLLLRRQRGAARLLRRRDRERGLEHRDGRPGDDRGRRAWACSRRRTSARSTCSGRTAWSTSGSRTTPRRSRRPSATCRTSAVPSEPAATPEDQAPLRNLIPTNRKRIYDVRARDRRAARRRARAAPRLRARDGDRARARRRQAARRDRQRPVAPRRRDRRPRRRQGGAIHAAVRRVRAPDPVAVRHARLHGRPAGRADGDRPPLRADVRHRRQPRGPDRHDRAAQGLRPRRPGDGRRRLQGGAVLRRLADLGVRRDGARGRGPARDAPRARGDRRRATSASAPTRRRSRPPTSAARGSTWPPTARSTT